MKCECCEKDFDFNKIGRGGNNRKYCYECYPSELSKQDRNKLRYKLLVFKAHEEKVKLGCSICGYNKFGGALEWHHPNITKEKNPSDALGISWEAYKKETDNCILVCANCHREIHNNE